MTGLRFNGTFSKNKLCCAFEKYFAVKTTEINEKTENVTLDFSSYNTFLAQVLYNL